MRRDDDYLRDLLLELEASDQWEHMGGIVMGSPPEEMNRHFHLLLLRDADMLEEMHEDVFRITNAGYDFLALTRDTAAWQATKSAARHLAGASIQMLYRIAEGIALRKLTELGVPIG